MNWWQSWGWAQTGQGFNPVASSRGHRFPRPPSQRLQSRASESAGGALGILGDPGVPRGPQPGLSSQRPEQGSRAGAQPALQGPPAAPSTPLPTRATSPSLNNPSRDPGAEPSRAGTCIPSSGPARATQVGRRRPFVGKMTGAPPPQLGLSSPGPPQAEEWGPEGQALIQPWEVGPVVPTTPRVLLSGRTPTPSGMNHRFHGGSSDRPPVLPRSEGLPGAAAAGVCGRGVRQPPGPQHAHGRYVLPAARTTEPH